MSSKSVVENIGQVVSACLNNSCIVLSQQSKLQFDTALKSLAFASDDSRVLGLYMPVQSYIEELLASTDARPVVVGLSAPQG